MQVFIVFSDINDDAMPGPWLQKVYANFNDALEHAKDVVRGQYEAMGDPCELVVNENTVLNKHDDYYLAYVATEEVVQ